MRGASEWTAATKGRLALDQRRQQGYSVTGPYFPLGIAALLLAVVARALYGTSGLLPSVILMFACMAVLGFAAQRVGIQRATLLLLAITVAIDRYTVNLAGLNMKAEHVAVALGMAVVAYQVLRSQSKLRLGLVEWLLLAWLGLNFIAGLINAPRPLGSVKLAVMLTLVAGAYFVTTHLVSTRSALFFATASLLLAGTSVALYGLIAHLLYPFGLDLGVQINPITKAPTVYATIWEGNLFGSFCAILAILWLTLRLTVPAASTRRAAEVGLVITLLGLEVSLARGAWLAFLAGLGFVMGTVLVSRRRADDLFDIAPKRWATLTAVLTLVSIVLWLNPLVYTVKFGSQLARTVEILRISNAKSTPVAVSVQPTPVAVSVQPTPILTTEPAAAVQRAQSAGNLSDPTYSQRRQDIVRALRDWRTHPLLGWGPGSYGQKYLTTSYTPAWLPTISLRVLHDTGVFGAIVFHTFLGLIVLQAWLTFWKTPDPLLRAILYSYIAGLGVLGIAYEITDGFQLAFAWFFLGLLVAATRLAEEEVTSQSRRGQLAHETSVLRANY